jgi:hypothetical protein
VERTQVVFPVPRGPKRKKLLLLGLFIILEYITPIYYKKWSLSYKKYLFLMAGTGRQPAAKADESASVFIDQLTGPGRKTFTSSYQWYQVESSKNYAVDFGQFSLLTQPHL